MVGVEQWAETDGWCSSSGVRSGRSRSRWGWRVTRSPGRSRPTRRRGMCGRRPGRSSIRFGSGSASSCRSTHRFSRCGCGSWRSSWAMRVASRSLMTTFARSVRGFGSGGRFSGRCIARGSWCSVICGSRPSRFRWVMGSGGVAGWSPRRCAGRARSQARWCSARRRPTFCGGWRGTSVGWGRCRRSWCGIASQRSRRAVARPRRSRGSAGSWRSGG